MEKRKLGNSGLEVFTLGLSCTAAELQEIEVSASQIKVTGERYPESIMNMTGR